ncbi:MAG: ester cyclase [Rhodobacteraceae bacterium]|nr:ester cyclase [Paracoccaceae bacterium]
MQGFDPQWRDFPDYIFGITRAIWEGRDLAGLHRWYAPDIVVRMPGGISTGNAGVIAATMATLSEFPDRRLLGEDVIWSGTPEAGMLSSHRILSTATHLGDGAFGPASGKALRYRIIADCHARADVIDDEWLIRDNGAIVRQMGWAPRAFARDQVAREGGAGACPRPFTPEIDRPGPYTGRGNDNEWGARLADTLTRIMGAEVSAIARVYDRAANLFYPGGLETCSHDGAERFWMGLRAAFPSAAFTIHHTIGRADPMLPPRAALRWSLDGTHDGWGAFGAPTGARVHVMGATHAEFGPWGGLDGRHGWGLRREHTLFDETAIWKQIVLHTGET